MMNKKAVKKVPRGPRVQGTGAKPKPLAKEVKIGKTKAKMIGGIIAVPVKPKRNMF